MGDGSRAELDRLAAFDDDLARIDGPSFHWWRAALEERVLDLVLIGLGHGERYYGRIAVGQQLTDCELYSLRFRREGYRWPRMTVWLAACRRRFVLLLAEEHQRGRRLKDGERTSMARVRASDGLGMAGAHLVDRMPRRRGGG